MMYINTKKNHSKNRAKAYRTIIINEEIIHSFN
jgi:hypothetical protein